MRVLFIISSSDTAFWLSEVTHPYWHLTERGVEVDFASPTGGKVVYDPYSDPYFEHSTEPDDLVSKGFLSDKELVAKLDATLPTATASAHAPAFLMRKVGRLTRRPTISLSVSAYTQPTCTTRFCASASDAVAGCAGN